MTTKMQLGLIALLAIMIIIGTISSVAISNAKPINEMERAKVDCAKGGAVPMAYFMHGGAPSEKRIMCVITPK